MNDDTAYRRVVRAARGPTPMTHPDSARAAEPEILSAERVAKIRGGDMFDWTDDVRDLCDSHERLRRENDGLRAWKSADAYDRLLGELDESRRESERLRAEVAAAREDTRRLEAFAKLLDEEGYAACQQDKTGERRVVIDCVFNDDYDAFDGMTLRLALDHLIEVAARSPSTPDTPTPGTQETGS